eukprot:EG_transcript_31899
MLLSQRLAFPDLFGQRSHSPAKATAVTAADSPGPVAAAVPFTPSRPGPWLTARTQPQVRPQGAVPALHQPHRALGTAAAGGAGGAAAHRGGGDGGADAAHPAAPVPQPGAGGAVRGEAGQGPEGRQQRGDDQPRPYTQAGGSPLPACHPPHVSPTCPLRPNICQVPLPAPDAGQRSHRRHPPVPAPLRAGR